MTDLDELRDELMRTSFGLREAAADPVQQFRQWFQTAKAAGLYEPRAMALATVRADGQPTARMVVLAGFDERGFDFATDDRSPKAADLQRQPRAALVFHWAELQRQVRVEGTVELLDAAATDAYFYQRARASQFATWLARQSDVLEGREVLEERLLKRLAEYEERPVPRPPYYVAYRVRPAVIEFWQARSDHINDRVRYHCAEDGAWIIDLLAP